MSNPMAHYWRVKKVLPQYYGRPCRLIKCGRMNSALVEFEDGTKHVTCRYYVRRLMTKE